MFGGSVTESQWPLALSNIQKRYRWPIEEVRIEDRGRSKEGER